MTDPNDGEIVQAGDLEQYCASLQQTAMQAYPGDTATCFNSKGPIRQRVWSCKTCAPTNSYMGVCYACSISCHTHHDLVEMLFIRDFTCACPQDTCRIDTGTKLSAADNKYTHNFDGVFCYCSTVYDPDVEQGTMFQCLICQDWMHDRCIGKVHDESVFEEFICKTCVAATPWITAYQVRGAFVEMQTSSTSIASIQDTVAEQGENDEPKNIDSLCDICILPPTPSVIPEQLFCVENWTDKLCKCPKCISMYKSCCLMFLIDGEVDVLPADAVVEVDFDRDQDTIRALDAFKDIPREKAIDGLLKFNEFKSDLFEFLGKIRDRGPNQVVTKQDLVNFANKRARLG